MSGKRSDMEINAAILQVARNGAKKSHIVYQANLNFKIGKKYLERLIHSGLLKEANGETHAFRTTAKGVDYLNYFRGLKDYLRT
jgi:predicted transcriptional regulator